MLKVSTDCKGQGLHVPVQDERLTLLLNSTILAMIFSSILGKMECPMNSMSLLVSWSTKTWKHRASEILLVQIKKGKYKSYSDFAFCVNQHNIYTSC